ncbi:hypothetical protein BX616_002086 [Lobosporangium transversale]|uniref:Uncharacterized protein n=1 Tax=Lobosporangium transversale TaxID=64571 RepID=A0A1Y2GKC0_9FUNG|nr:hypothetical protein BCR41DRAFT_371291 [Lobosporangium transversale]KAF9901931.1 hypothetical protein BX616_002086 [Lobosporangium transversale]ORZ13767.1 hypothetical protein BCR41DRAFT_371291 [Lobosporangium transversale]|eukprot:XP_021880551.1 hypothetical protein BCR41DRAFT_371291 [Lobosporangium transversale]
MHRSNAWTCTPLDSLRTRLSTDQVDTINVQGVVVNDARPTFNEIYQDYELEFTIRDKDTGVEKDVWLLSGHQGYLFVIKAGWTVRITHAFYIDASPLPPVIAASAAKGSLWTFFVS